MQDIAASEQARSKAVLWKSHGKELKASGSKWWTKFRPHVVLLCQAQVELHVLRRAQLTLSGIEIFTRYLEKLTPRLSSRPQQHFSQRHQGVATISPSTHIHVELRTDLRPQVYVASNHPQHGLQ